jgi:hypothetical protein
MDPLMRAALSVQGAYGALLERAHSEQGVSTTQYAFLVALILAKNARRHFHSFDHTLLSCPRS